MENWKTDPNKRAIAIIRRSSQGQKDNTSATTQEREIREYAKAHGLELVKVEQMIETAYKSEERTKYQALMLFAQSQGILHFLTYNGSREARNNTDGEKNEQLIREGKLIIHHVSENKVFDRNTPDSEFLAKDILTAVNRNYSRENGTKMKAAYKTKAENGHFPFCHTPLGYVHFKDKDSYGNPIKGTARLIKDPNDKLVRLVQREFELRARGFTLDQIRRANLDDGIVLFDVIRKYSRHAIEVRLKNPLYRGYFFLGDIRYEGKHEIIIDQKVLKTVDRINTDSSFKPKSKTDEPNVFAGWLICGHPECQRAITHDPKKKTLKGSGEQVTYHYYRCSNSRKVHEESPTNFSEAKIWNMFEPAVEALDISEDFAKDIAAALNETHVKQNAAIRKQMEGFRLELRGLEGREDRAYSDFTNGVLDKAAYQRQINRVREDRKHYENEIERLTISISDEGMVSVKKVIELAINAKSLWKSMEREDRVEYLKTVVIEPKLEDLTLHYQLEKPFARLASWKENKEWRRE